jgi:nucleoside 2-deoxyribosyltransferase
MLTIVGGVYVENCLRPGWKEVYGSGGRAATAIARMGGEVVLHSYLDEQNLLVMQGRAALENFELSPMAVEQGISFHYNHGLENPTMRGSTKKNESFQINAEKVIRFGFIEGDAVIKSQFAVYDPQNASNPELFRANGSAAEHLALVLNQYEARVMSGLRDEAIEVVAQTLADLEQAEVVVIKLGPFGALVYDKGKIETIPAYQTNNVWKIGSGDNFVAHFGYAWMEKGLSAVVAACEASKATAYYCNNMGFPSPSNLADFNPSPVIISENYRNGLRPKVYLAGPFFSLAQLWLVDQARNNLRDLGLEVFSPFHDVGHGSAEDVVQKDLDGIHTSDLIFAIGDGLDSGTIYEIGYACALKKPVIMYVENESEEDEKMMQGSGCIICDDYVTAIYKTLWVAVTL